jgi:serine phosphatase RsbU (regulator of sigma subunit)
MKRDPRISYAIAGALFGLSFPVISTLFDIAVQGMPFSIASITEVQQTQPLHWVIDSAPLFLGLLSYFVGVRQHAVLELNQNLEKKVETRTEQLQEQNLELKSIQEKLEETLNKISQSITYADRIQRAFLKSIEQLKSDLPGSFVYYKPRDIVSGDFPWYVQHNGFTYIAAVDCTGHGVPGAMMSIIGNFLLHRVVNEMGVSDTGAILSELHQQVRETLDQHGVKDVQD